MAVTPILNLPLISESQSSKFLTHNEAISLLEVVVGSGIVDKDLTTPPASPSANSAYVVASPATGVWAGKEKNIAIYLNAAWVFVPPNTAIAPLFVRDEQADYYYNGTAWVARVYAGSASPNTAFTNLTQTYTRAQTVQTNLLTDGTTITVDCDLANVFRVTLAGNRTITFTNLKDGQTIILEIIQDATGSRTVTWDAIADFGTDGQPTLTTTPSKKDILTFISNGTKAAFVGIKKGFAA